MVDHVSWLSVLAQPRVQGRDLILGHLQLEIATISPQVTPEDVIFAILDVYIHNRIFDLGVEHEAEARESLKTPVPMPGSCALITPWQPWTRRVPWLAALPH